MSLKEGMAKKVVEALLDRGLYVTTVESCTGGELASAITDIEGASAVFGGGRITYSNEEKIAQGVPEEIIKQYTVYSNETAAAMAAMGLEKAVRADIAIATTGSLNRVDPANEEASMPGELFMAVKFKRGREGDVIYATMNIDPLLDRVHAKEEAVIGALSLLWRAIALY